MTMIEITAMVTLQMLLPSYPPLVLLILGLLVVEVLQDNDTYYCFVVSESLLLVRSNERKNWWCDGVCFYCR